MKKTSTILAIIFIGLSITAQAGQLYQDPYPSDGNPIWIYRDNEGNRTVIEKDQYSNTPVYHYHDSEGNSGTIEQDPYAINPTWNINED